MREVISEDIIERIFSKTWKAPNPRVKKSDKLQAGKTEENPTKAKCAIIVENQQLMPAVIREKDQCF